MLLACLIEPLSIQIASASGGVDELWSPAEPKSNCETLTLGANGDLYLSWIEKESTGHVLKFSIWEHERWAPAQVIARGASWPVNVADTPGLTVLADGTTVMAHWLLHIPGSHSSTIRMAYSLNAGVSWSKTLALPGDEKDAWRGVLSWAPLSQERAALVWCEELNDEKDPRRTRGGTTTGLCFSTLSRNGELSEPVVLDRRVCGWCAPDLAAGGNGSLVIAYRDRAEDGACDISCLCYDGTSWSKSARVHDDGWHPSSCPVNGPAVDAQDNHVAVAWLTDDEDGQSFVRTAFSSDGGHVFAPPIDVSSADPVGRPDITLLPDGTAYVVWVDKVEDQRILTAQALAEIRLRRVAPDGSLGTPIAVAQTGQVRESLFPHLAHLGDVTYVTWTEAPPLRALARAPRTVTPTGVHVARVR